MLDALPLVIAAVRAAIAQVTDLVAETNATVVTVAAGVGILAVAWFLWSILKGAIKLAVLAAIVAAVAWFFFFREVA